MKEVLQIITIGILLQLFSCKEETKAPFATASEEITIKSSFLERVEPPNWWVGFKDEKLQLLIKEDNISLAKVALNYTGVTIDKVNKADSPNYLFIDLLVSKTAKAGDFNLEFTFPDGTIKKHTYTLNARTKPADDYVGFSSVDAIYLITPDRFANADPSNDIDTTLLEKTINRADDYGRHGGDVKGMTEHLDYIHDMGFTAIWSTPVLLNDMPEASYHGYAITDHYKIDSRFGTMQEYKELAGKAQELGIKFIMDQVANHCGDQHWWIKDLPFKDWLNYQEEYENKAPLITSNHKRTVNQDTYAATYDKDLMSKGWFVPAMPDLNQKNPFMATYLIQNSIWWIETLDLGGIRHDTHPYPDKEFMSNWGAAIMKEYPNFSIVGEEWSYNPLLVGYWQTGANNKDGYESNLKSTMDFPMQLNIVNALNEEESWDTGLVKLYEGLANDFHYTKPEDIMIFGDNHDMDRIYTQLKENVAHTKMALGTMLVMPRIAQLYYGTEILMQNTAKPGDHGLIRTDFPGGWDGDTVNAFTGEGLTNEQADMQLFVKKMLNYRKHSKAIHKGKTIQFAPFDGVYMLFRVLKEEVVVVILNKNKGKTIDLNRFSELELKGKSFKNIISNATLIWGDSLELNEKGITILSTKTN